MRDSGAAAIKPRLPFETERAGPGLPSPPRDVGDAIGSGGSSRGLETRGFGRPQVRLVWQERPHLWVAPLDHKELVPAPASAAPIEQAGPARQMQAEDERSSEG